MSQGVSKPMGVRLFDTRGAAGVRRWVAVVINEVAR